ncbi:MAG: 6-carboxytetrahydropterin synthase QueD [Chloroflexi bacterium RBG_13_46_14]|nr:MAG: 6-carboxytetrahydropterin synthase QueD [Chloroflexi bacterium RBG_13_46_14]
MYRVSIERHFDAAHYLREYEGKCENLHGHRYKVVANLKTDALDKTGLAFDFTILKKSIDKILERFDHTCLNDIEPFTSINPSSENIASTIYGELKPYLDGQIAIIESIQVWESPDAWITYFPD